jgi:hypothetical protein
VSDFMREEKRKMMMIASKVLETMTKGTAMT